VALVFVAESAQRFSVRETQPALGSLQSLYRRLLI
jgi:hypothetical protein